MIWALTVALIALRRWRHLLIYLVVSQLAQLAHARLYVMARDLRLAGSCDVTVATEVVADVPGARRFERSPGRGSNLLLTWFEVFPGGCANVRLSSGNPAQEVLADVSAQANRVIHFVPRTDLAHALDERSDGRLHLDPGE